MNSDELLALARREARRELWRMGRASEFLLDDGQREWVEAFRQGDGASVWMIGRQRGKSFAALTLACEECIRRPGIIVRYAALTGKSAKAIVKPTLAMVLADCPPDVAPRISEQEGLVEFPNGSIITWAGTDNEQFDRLRGPRAHLILLDESAFYADLERVESALLPQLTTTAGQVLYLSTPPESIAHTFTNRYRAAQAVRRARHSTINDNPRLGPQGVERIARLEAERLGLTLVELLKSTFWRREYLAELVTEGTRAAFPSWTEELHAKVVGDWQRPAHFDAYQAHDPGKVGDPFASLFGYFDPATGTLTIEDELELPSASHSVGQWCEAIKAKETDLYGVTKWDGTLLGAEDMLKQLGDIPDFLRSSISNNAPRQPYLRVGDDAGVCKDLTVDHGVAVFPTAKHEKALEVSNANQALFDMRIRIHSRCKRLIAQLYSTIWNQTRSRWERTPIDHGDLAGDCLPYMHRNVRWNRDCRPKHVDSATRIIQETQRKHSLDAPANGWAKVFGSRK